MATQSGSDGFTVEGGDEGMFSHLNWDEHIKPPLKYIALAVVMAFCVLPLYFTFVNSLKSPEMIFTSTMGIPWVTFQPATGQNQAWVSMWESFPFIKYVFASFIASFGTATLATGIAISAAYAFARLDFPQKNKLFILSICAFMFPRAIIAIPIFLLLNKMGMLNTYVGLIVAFTSFTLPYNIWLLRGFFEDLPDNLEESARVDGCTQFGAFYRVILPLSRPAIASVFMLAFLLAWHNFLLAFLIGNDDIHTTLPVAILSLKSQFFVQSFHFILAATFLTMIIPVIFYMYLQKHLVEGLSAGSGVKG
ncbi:MAG: carbohydrate ABC transporter permease [Haloferacaceae archaeon]